MTASAPFSDRQNALWPDLVDPEFLKTLREAVERTVAPHAAEIDRQDVYPVASVKALAGLGYTSMTLPEQFGGEAASHTLCAALFEEVSYHSAAVGISLITIFQAQTLVLLYGRDSLKSRVLPLFRRGLITSYALTEAAHGSDIRSLDTKAHREGDHWILDGRKSFITSGSAAEAFIVLAETPTGVSTFFVDAQLDGISCETGPHAATFGLRNGPHVDLILDRVAVPEDHLLGAEGQGVRQAVTTLDFSRTMAAAISVGIARAAIDGALDYASNRTAFEKTVASFQGIQWYFADMIAELDAARLLVHHAAAALDRDEDIARYASEAKLVASGLATRVASLAIQICGAHGVRDTSPFGRYLRDAKAYEIAGGSSEILKNTIVKQILRSRPA